MADALITLEEAKSHLNIVTDAFDIDIQTKAEAASVLVLERCNSTAYWRTQTTTWTADTAPQSVRAAVFLVLAHLFQHRGDDMKLDEMFWKAVDRLLGYHRDPVVA